MLPFKVEKVYRPELEAAKQQLAQQKDVQTGSLNSLEESPGLFEDSPYSREEPFEFISSDSFNFIELDGPLHREDSDFADLFLRQ